MPQKLKGTVTFNEDNQERLHGARMEEILKSGEERKEILGRGDSRNNGTKLRNTEQS